MTLVNQINAISQIQGGTNPGDGLRFGTNRLVAQRRAGAKTVACMSTDGITNSGEALSTAVPYAQSQAIDEYTVVGIEDPGSPRHPQAHMADVSAAVGRRPINSPTSPTRRRRLRQHGGRPRGLEVSQSVQR